MEPEPLSRLGDIPDDELRQLHHEISEPVILLEQGFDVDRLIITRQSRSFDRIRTRRRGNDCHGRVLPNWRDNYNGPQN